MLTQRPMNNQKIEQSDECCFGWEQILSYSFENFVLHEKKKVNCQCPKSTKQRNHFDYQTQSVPQDGSTFPQASL